MSLTKSFKICEKVGSFEEKELLIDMTVQAENSSRMDLVVSKEEKNVSKEELRYTIHIFGRYKIQIFKPLILLKTCLFLLFGAGSYMTASMIILYKQRGVTLKEISIMYILAPISQILLSGLAGLIADKLGRAKPVFIAIILFTIGTVACILFIPPLIPESCHSSQMNITCGHQNIESHFSTCDTFNTTLQTSSCHCLSNCPHMCFNHENVSLKLDINGTYYDKGHCFYQVRTVYDLDYSICQDDLSMPCSVSCSIQECPEQKYSHKTVLIAYAILYILYLTFYSNAYRMMDVMAMSLTKEHNADYGHERFFSICGNLFISPLAGYLVYSTTPALGRENYESAMYMNVVMNVILLISVYHLKTPQIPPGKNMAKKSLHFFKSLDIIVYFLMLLVLGTAWNFSKYYVFWYIEDLGGSSLLIGLLPSVGALYGLPFLLTSKFWMAKLGAQLIFFLAFIAYVIIFLSYSFIVNTWISLVIEILGIFTYYLFWVAVMDYSHDIAPEGIRALVMSMSGAIHFSGGKTTVGLTGGLVMSAFGGRYAFRIMALMCLVFGILYGVYCFLRRTHLKKKSTT